MSAERDWKLIRRYSQEYEAELAQQKLADADIHAVVLDKQDIITGVIGSFELMVPVDEEEAAERLLEPGA